jgi:betaine-aldehyde dehydrogenase
VVALSRKVAFGDPLHEATKVGAIISPGRQAKIDGSVRGAVAAGANERIGGAPLDAPGLGEQFCQPTLVAGGAPDTAIAREEVYGPVLSVLTFKTLDEAIGLAKAAACGLSAGVWGENVHTCLEFARRAQAGAVWINSWMGGFAEPPFSGVKVSGQGREFGRYGLDEFLEVKTVQMRIGRTRTPWVITR